MLTFFLLLLLQGEKRQESRELVLTSESPWGGEEEGVHNNFQKIKIANNVLHSLVKEVICGGKNHSGKSEAVDVLTHV